MFSRIIIIGVGLLGGSVGLAARRRHPTAEIVGVERSRSTMDTALRLGTIDTAWTDLQKIPVEEDDPTLVVVCTPVGVIRTNVRRVLDHFGPCGDLLVTDVGSTKASLCREIDDPRFLGSHPIAGSQCSGPESARTELFDGRLTVLTPTKRHRRIDVERLRRFWESLGSTVVEMSAEKHDEILAVTSHLPHLLSVSLASIVTDEERPLTGTGYADMTRLAAGPMEVWRDIFLDNDANLLAAIRRFQARLEEFAEILESKDERRLEILLRQK